MYMTVLKMTRKSILNAKNLLNIESSNSVHKWLCQQQDSSRKEAEILYKIINKQDEIYMYIQSKNKFNISNIENAGFVFVKELDLSKINLNNITYFDVQCFPNKQTNNKQYFLKNINDRVNWLQNQFYKHGIILLSCTEYKLSNIILDKDVPKQIETASYNGKIKIVNPELAKEFFINGLGRFKNYGLGLILFK